MLIERGPAGAMKILIVDDEPSILESLADLLRREFHVYATDDVDLALGLMQSQEIALILTDQRMPKLSGTELLSRATEINPQCVRMLLTAYSDVEAVIQAINEGRVYYYLSKPWDPARLPEVIRAATQQYALAAENKRLLQQLAEVTSVAETAQAQAETLKGEGTRQQQANQMLQSALEQLQNSHWHLRKIKELLPICMACGKVQTGESQWETLEQFFQRHSTFLTHGYCPECVAPLMAKLDNAENGGPDHGSEPGKIPGSG